MVLVLVALGIAHPYMAARVGPGACLADWNDPTSGQTRRRFDHEAIAVLGTPLQRMWLGPVVGTCFLAYIRPDGKGVLWMRMGLNWTRRLVSPPSAEYRLAVLGVSQPNVIADLVPGELPDHPLLGTLSQLSESATPPGS